MGSSIIKRNSDGVCQMKILIAVDFSAVGKKVAVEGYRLAKQNGWQPVFFTCLPKMSDFFAGYVCVKGHSISAAVSKEEEKRLKKESKKNIEDLIAVAEKKYGLLDGKKAEIKFGTGTAADEIIKITEADKEYKSIIVGYKSHSTLSTLLVGSTAAKVARYAPCTVVIYRP